MKDFIKTAAVAGALYVTYKIGYGFGIIDTVKFINRAEGSEISDLKEKAQKVVDELSELKAKYEQ